MMESKMAVNASNTECCLMNMVDKTIETHRMKEHTRIPLRFFNVSFSRMAMCAIMEL